MDMVSSVHFSLSAHAVLSVLVTQTCSSQSLSSSDTSAGISDSTWPNLKSGFLLPVPLFSFTGISGLLVVGTRKQGVILDSFLSFPNLQSITQYLLSPLSPKYILHRSVSHHLHFQEPSLSCGSSLSLVSALILVSL